MKKLIISSFAILALTACATGPSAYGPASSGTDLGFSTTKIENDRFRVSYTGRSTMEAQDYALLRASEIALAEGYSHFRIVTGNLDKRAPNRSGVSTNLGIGIGGGRGYRRGGTSVGLGIGINDIGRALSGERVTNAIEIKLLNSGISDDPNVFSAKDISENIRPATFK